MQEIWKKLVYPNIPDDLNRFEISTCGRLRNKITHHIYKLDVLSSGYCSVRTTLGSRNNKIHILIHKAVAYTFLSNKDNLPEVNHKDGDKTNNSFFCSIGFAIWSFIPDFSIFNTSSSTLETA